MKCNYQQLTPKEAEELKDYISFSTKIMRIVFVLFVIAVLTFFFNKIMYYVNVEQPVWIMFSLSLFIWYFFNKNKLTGDKDFFNLVKKDIDDGRCKLITIEPKYIIKIEENEDEGNCYIIQDKDNVFIFMSGQELYTYEKDGFPWESFAIRESVNAKIEFGIEKKGHDIQVSKILPSFSISLNTLKEIGAFERTAFILTDKQLQLLKKEINL